MKKRYVAISLTLGSLALAGGAQADTWDVTQKVTVGANTTVTQENGNTSATQAMNAIDVGDLNGTSQKVEMGIYTLGLSQTGATTTTSSQAANTVKADTISGAFSQEVNSTAAASAIALTQSAQGEANVQALNLAGATTVVGSSGVFAQKVTPTGTAGDITLTQLTATGKDSVQAANYIKGTTITSATQTVDNDSAGNGDITLVQPTGTSSLTQAVNYATAELITSLAQNIKTVDFVLGQTGGTSNVQAGNYAQGTVTGIGTLLSQKTDASGMIDMDQITDGSGNLQAVNAADVKSVTGAVTQAATTGAANINLNQNYQTNSQQFVNYLKSTGTVASVTQDYLNSGKTATLAQDNAGTSQQALNAIEMTDVAGVLTKGTQTVTLDTLSLSQGKITANTGSSQAANLLRSKNDIAEASQTVTADIDVTQEKGTGNLQAVNLAAGIDITTSLTQKINGTSDTFEQGSAGAATNTQAGNYLAVGASGEVASVVQNYDASDSVKMDQNYITSGVQGLNVIDASVSGVKVTSANQKVSVPSLTMRQGQNEATTKSVQAGNAVLTDSSAVGGKVDQDVTVTTLLAMYQANSSRSVQAANFVGNRPL